MGGLPLNYDDKTNTLPESNSLHLKMDGWNTSFLLDAQFTGAILVSGRVLDVFSGESLEVGGSHCCPGDLI